MAWVMPAGIDQGFAQHHEAAALAVDEARVARGALRGNVALAASRPAWSSG